MVRKILVSLLIFLLMTSISEAAADLSNKTELQDIRYSISEGKVRIVLDFPKRVAFRESYAENPSRMIVSLENTWIDVKRMKRDIELNSTAASRIRVAQFDPSTVRVVIESMAATNVFWLGGGPSGQRLVIDLTDVNYKPPVENKTPPDDNTDNSNEDNVDNPPDDDVDNTDEENIDNPPDDNVENPDEDNIDNEDVERDNIKTDNEIDTKSDTKSDNKSDRKSDRRDRRDRNKTDKTDDKKSDKTDDNKSGNADDENNDIDSDLEDIMMLKGKVIVLDAGHGGGDSGAIGPTGVTEKSVTLRVAIELRALLEDAGAKVIMTRRNDKAVSRKGDKASAIEELQARCDVANKAKADIFISIHADSFTNPAARGTTGYYFAQSEGGKSKKLADAIRKALCEQLHTPSRGTKPCNFYVVRHTDMPATLIELAFISNPEEEELLDSDEGVMKSAQGIFDGIEDYFG